MVSYLGKTELLPNLLHEPGEPFLIDPVSMVVDIPLCVQNLRMVLIAGRRDHFSVKGIECLTALSHFGYHIGLNAIFTQYLGHALSPSAFVQDKSPHLIIKAAAQHMGLDPEHFLQFIAIMHSIQGKIRVVHVHHFPGMRQFITLCKNILERLIGKSAIEKLYLHIRNPLPKDILAKKGTSLHRFLSLVLLLRFL